MSIPFTPLELLAWMVLAGSVAVAVAFVIFLVLAGVALWKEIKK